MFDFKDAQDAALFTQTKATAIACGLAHTLFDWLRNLSSAHG